MPAMEFVAGNCANDHMERQRLIAGADGRARALGPMLVRSITHVTRSARLNGGNVAINAKYIM